MRGGGETEERGGRGCSRYIISQKEKDRIREKEREEDCERN